MKPDWATRLQRTFARKYDAGFAKGLMLGKAVGARDERDRIALTLEIEAERHQQLLLTASAEYLLNLSRAIKGENK